MKKGLLALGLLIGCMSVVSAQPPEQPPQEWAEKLFGPPADLVHDFGNVPHGALLHHDFVVTNIYAVPIEITSIRGGMGCLTVRASKQELQPNEKAIISVTMDARRFTGQKTVCIYVSVSPPYSTAVLTLQAVSRNDIVCNPDTVAFNSVAAGQTPSATLDVEYAGPLAWQVGEPIVSKDAPFEATVNELYRHPGDAHHGEVGYQVKVTLKKDAAPGQFQQSIFLKTNDPSVGLLPVWVTGNIQSPLEAVPATLNLKEVKSGAALTRRVFVRSPKPFKIVGIEGPDAVKLGESPLPNQGQTVTLEIVPPPQEGPFHYEVKIKTDLQDAPVVVAIDGVVPKK